YPVSCEFSSFPADQSPFRLFSGHLWQPLGFQIGIDPIHDIVCFGPRPRPHNFVSVNSHEQNFPVGHPLYDCSRAISLNFGVPMESEANELPKGLVLYGGEHVHIRHRGSTPMYDM
ncbi:hypothetical protein DVH24_031538, partial [Malus domestica]